VHTAFVKFLRPEQRFDGLDALVTAMKADEAAARAVLAGARAPLL
jgi:riboflavin kinase/FMN adenylyltransferase